MASTSEQVVLQNLNGLASTVDRSHVNRLLTPVDETVRRKGSEILENDCGHLNENASSIADQAPEVASGSHHLLHHHLDPGPPLRISSYRQDPVQFNVRMAETRERIVRNMLLSSYKVAQREIDAEERRLAEARQRGLEAEERSRQSLRRQMLRGQELDQVQASVVNYDFASMRNAQADQQLTTSMLTLLTSVGARRDRYADSLKARLQ